MEETPKRSRKGTVITALLMVVCICVLSFSLYNLAEIYLGYAKAQNIYSQLLEENTEGESLKIDWDKLLATNPDIVGWIEIPGTPISYPVLQGADNFTYLYRTFDNQQSNSGSIFLDVSVNADFSSYNTLVHGHNMKDGSMFSQLERFTEESFLKDHEVLYIHTPDATRQYRLFQCRDSNVSDAWYRTEFTGFEDFTKFAEAESVKLEDEAARVITLATCTNVAEQGRYLVLGMLEEVGEPVTV